MATFNIYVPSYRRSHAIQTAHTLEYCTYVIRKSEEQSYRDAGITDLVAVEDSKIDSLLKVIQWIVDNAEEDVIAMIDDDIEHLIYRLDYNNEIEDPAVATAEIERIAQIMYDLGIGYGGVDFTSKLWGYTSEFGFTGVAGGLRWFNRAVYKAVPDFKAEKNDDIDRCLQELLHNRIILKPKYLCVSGEQNKNEGGTTDGKTRREQLDSIEYMSLKWGDYFRYNLKTNVPNIIVKR